MSEAIKFYDIGNGVLNFHPQFSSDSNQREKNALLEK